MTNLGACYQTGRGVGKNEAAAVDWYQRAADKGYGPAMNVLGICYATGAGVERDVAEAVRWYRRAAGKEYEPARQALARLGEN